MSKHETSLPILRCAVCILWNVKIVLKQLRFHSETSRLHFLWQIPSFPIIQVDTTTFDALDGGLALFVVHQCSRTFSCIWVDWPFLCLHPPECRFWIRVQWNYQHSIRHTFYWYWSTVYYNNYCYYFVTLLKFKVKLLSQITSDVSPVSSISVSSDHRTFGCIVSVQPVWLSFNYILLLATISLTPHLPISAWLIVVLKMIPS